ncbi:CD1871A family CXXC motif-containing protein [Lutispora sp.]|jgi:hypothetical protein
MKEKTKYILLLMSFVLIAMGVYRGEVKEVLQKAINICLECIGIG